MERLLKSEKKIFLLLFKKAKKEKIGVHFVEINKGFKIFIVAKDWAGLVDAVTGALHKRGYNIGFLMGFIFKKGYACLLIKIPLSNSLKKEFVKKISEIEHHIKNIAVFDPGLNDLLKTSSVKLEKFKSVLNLIKEKIKKIPFSEKEYLQEREKILKETDIFFTSRSCAYIDERTPEDLAQQILTNYFLQREVKKDKGIHIHIANFKTAREHLTGITVAGLDRVIFLDHLLDILREIITDFKRKFDKQFTTPQGITVIRLEITDENDRPIPEEKHLLIENYILSHLRKYKSSVIQTKLRVSPEMVGRVLVPRLIEEVNRTGIPNVYILSTGATRENFFFKIIGVAQQKNKDELYEKKLIHSFNMQKGISVVSVKAPTKFNNMIEVDLVDIQADREVFSGGDELVYPVLKNVLQKVYGKYRDFDEGMRTIEIQRLNTLIENLSGTGVEINYIKRFFYGLDEFYRISAPLEDLASSFKFLWELLLSSISKGGGLRIEKRQGINASFLFIVGRGSENIFDTIIEKIAYIESYILSFNELGIPSYLVFLTRDKKPLDEKEIAQILEGLPLNL